MDRAAALHQQIEYYQQHQQQLLGDIQRALYDASHVSRDSELAACSARHDSFGCSNDELLLWHRRGKPMDQRQIHP
jgi:hypothetical protein